MYNEFKRFSLFRIRRWQNSLSDLLYKLILIGILYSLLRDQPDFHLPYFYYYFILSQALTLGNEELEYEIRSGQVQGLTSAARSIYQIYLQRALVYLIWLSLIFVGACLLLNPSLISHLTLPENAFPAFLALGLCSLIFLLFYWGMIFLTLTYQRVSVFIQFLNTLMLFYSGLAFPVKAFPNLATILNNILR